MINKVIYIIFVCSILFSSKDESEMHFQYGVLSTPRLYPDSTIALIDSSVVNNGDRLWVNLGYKSNTYFYVIMKSNDGTYSNLDINCSQEDDMCYFSNTMGTFDSSIGDEVIYLINSDNRQDDLEKLLLEYDSVSEKLKNELTRKIGYKILSLTESDKLAGRMDIGGELEESIMAGIAFRGDNKEINVFSLTHDYKSSDKVAVKKIVLDHK